MTHCHSERNGRPGLRNVICFSGMIALESLHLDAVSLSVISFSHYLCRGGRREDYGRRDTEAIATSIGAGVNCTGGRSSGTPCPHLPTFSGARRRNQESCLWERTMLVFASIEVLLSNMTYWDGNRPARRLTFWLDNRNQKLFGASTKIYQTDDFVRAWHFTQESTSGEYISPLQNDTIAKEHKQEAKHISYKTLKLPFITTFYFHWKIYLLQILIYFVVHPQRIERESTSVLMSRHVFSLLVSIINYFILIYTDLGELHTTSVAD